MFKVISVKEYAKLTGEIDYWKARALQQEKMKRFLRTEYNKEYSKSQRYYEEYIESERENDELKKKIKELEKEKVTFVSFKGIKDLNEAKILAEKVRKSLNNEHQCDENCFEEHILPAIQRDYEYKLLEFMLDRDERYHFLKYWDKKLKNEYDFIEDLYMITDTIMVRFK